MSVSNWFFNSIGFSIQSPQLQIVPERRQISKEEAKELIHYVFSAPAIHKNTWHEWMEPSGYQQISPSSLPLHNLPGNLEARNHCFFDPETGLKVAIFKKNIELLIVFGATNSSELEVPESDKGSYVRKVLLAASYNFVWARPLLFERAHELVQILKSHFQNFEIVLTGQSLGGGLASYVGVKLETKAICFNSLPLGSWIKKEVSSATFNLAERNITQVSIETDFLSDNFLFKIYTPILPGKRLFVPTAYPTSIIETHGYIVGSFLDFLGFDKCEKPATIIDKI